jgi:methylenetetrahydrofolate dehydrogenase (NADP+) / methenyltetrahydrofolate cyclohydrolase
MQILDGKALSNKIKDELKIEVESLKKNHDVVPGLAVILVGADPASQAYVSMKSKACKAVGIYSIVHEMPSTISHPEILEIIKMMNNNNYIDGILVQLPLPDQVDTISLLEAVDVSKDVDGFHPYNMGQLVQGLDGFVPCTPLGVMELLAEYNIDVKGLNACVVGASNIVGKPMASLLLNAGATVDICHIFTKDLKAHTLNADIVLVGVGKPDLITPDMLKEGAIVVDIGINKVENKLVGDVSFDAVKEKVSYITPVPGGVGPMTIAMLLKNTVEAAKARRC